MYRISRGVPQHPPTLVIDFYRIILILSFAFSRNLRNNYACTVGADPATCSFLIVVLFLLWALKKPCKYTLNMEINLEPLYINSQKSKYTSSINVTPRLPGEIYTVYRLLNMAGAWFGMQKLTVACYRAG